MTFTEAAAEVLRLAGKPLHYKEITELAIEKNLLSHVGKSPEVTMGARLAALLKKEDKTNPIVRVKPGVFALREWSSGGRAEAREDAADDGESDDVSVNALEVEAAAAQRPPTSSAAALAPGGYTDEEDDDDEVSGDDALRADLAASGAELFDDEEDDDQPILLGAAQPAAAAGGVAPQQGEGLQGEGGGRRRRRRRRRRGGGGGGGLQPQNGEVFGREATAPSMTAVAEGENPDAPRDMTATQPMVSRPIVRDRQQIMSAGAQQSLDHALPEGDELAGRDLADAAIIVLSAFDRNAGPVPIRSIVDHLVRRGRLGGDPAVASTQLAASLRADNLRRAALGQRTRFRFASGGRVAPTEWLLGADLVRLEQDVIAAVDRYRDGARRVMLRRVQELPGHSFVELALVALERLGMTQVKLVRRAGTSGGEAHFAAIHKTGGDEIRTAIVIRKDGREIGRERVGDLRGTLHHYGPAVCGWLITTGQVLSGAREEAAASGAPPIALYDGLTFCKLLEDEDVGVVRTQHTIALPNLELLEAIRGGS
jgi:HB1, ASXL, restriction endonuclease HTH domain/Restriction endonuclease